MDDFSVTCIDGSLDGESKTLINEVNRFEYRVQPKGLAGR